MACLQITKNYCRLRLFSEFFFEFIFPAGDNLFEVNNRNTINKMRNTFKVNNKDIRTTPFDKISILSYLGNCLPYS